MMDNLNCIPVESSPGHLFQDPLSFWLVTEGYVDVFIVPIDAQNEILSNGLYCFRIKTGGIIFGHPPLMNDSLKQKIALWGVPSSHAKIQKGDAKLFLTGDFDLSIVEHLDRWIQTVEKAVGSPFPVPRQYSLLEADPNVAYSKGMFLSAYYMDVVWVESLSTPLFYGGEKSLVLPPKHFHPVTHWGTVELQKDSSVHGYHTPEMMLRDDFWDIFSAHQQFFMQIMAFNFNSRAMMSEGMQRDFRDNSNSQMQQAQNLLANTLNPKRKSSTTAISGDSLTQICTKVLGEWGMKESSKRWETHKNQSQIEILERMNFGVRKVNLRDWNYKKNISGYIIAQNKIGKTIGFLPPYNQRKHYTYFDPDQNIERQLTSQDIEDSSFTGRMIYPPIPKHVKDLKSFYHYLMSGKKGLLKTMLFIAAINTLFFILSPILTGKILNHYIPYHDWEAFTLTMLALLMTGLGGLLLCVVSSLLYISLSGHLSLYAQAGLWRKLISFPPHFFQRYSIGEILDRMNSINIVSGLLNVSFIQYLSSFISGAMGLMLLLYYDAIFTSILLLIMSALVFIDYFLIKKFISLERESHKLQFKSNDFMLQVLNALSKIRIARREGFVLFHWIQSFSKRRRIIYRSHLLRSFYQTLHSHFFFYANIALFFIMSWRLSEALQNRQALLEHYIVFNMALAQFAFFMNQISIMASLAFSAVPFIEKIRPILSEKLETPHRNIYPENLRGRVEFSHVHFSYRDLKGNLTPVLKDVSFTIEAGEYVAIVGSSGSGKSTVIRLLLGLENLQSGSIHLDHHNLEGLDLQSLRNQMGVVLQSTQILPTSVIKNIAMGSEQEKDKVSEIYKQAWWALRKASLEEDIIKMPMGMHTPLGQGSLMSGGQRQRLLIARALNKNPRILLFDEATSAMDNVTQGRIKEMLDNLNITRIIIAHRLSTITNVNRVIMLKDGKIVEQGSYQRLLKLGGEFAKFAQRQVF